MLIFLDYFFLIFHTLLILFNVFGWIWKPLRLANLITLVLTGSSWFLLGIFYGFGFCPLTEWHFSIVEKLGETDLPYSYIQYLVSRISGIMPDEKLTDHLTLVFYFLALAASAFVNLKERLSRRKVKSK